MSWVPISSEHDAISPDEVDRLREIRRQSQEGVIEGIILARAIMKDEGASRRDRLDAFRALLKAGGVERQSVLMVRYPEESPNPCLSMSNEELARFLPKKGTQALS
jgi:hypothetical protein